MKIKVCGMANADNISEIAQLLPDYMGFIFYPSSKRYIFRHTESLHFYASTKNITPQKVGVFVNEEIKTIIHHAENYTLQYLQLHGNESVSDCIFLRNKGYKIIKAIGVNTAKDIISADKYQEVCDYILFDTKTDTYGGSGIQFDSTLINEYKGNLPFFLSGGISHEYIANNLNYYHPKLYCIDINSRYEISPAIKDINLIKKTIELIRSI